VRYRSGVETGVTGLIPATLQKWGVAERPTERAGRRFVDPLGAEAPHDGASPIGWYLAANVLVVRGGKVLLVRQPPAWGGRWELPGGGADPGGLLVEAAARECHEETGYQFVPWSAAPFHVEEAWLRGSRGGYNHAVAFIFRGEAAGDVDPGWTQDHDEIVEIAWLDPRQLSAATTRALHWPALRKAGLV
jgi:8-oxo-dGTP pyrophosphatase MutT (NUDIX family)